MEVLTVPVGFLADANAARPPEHAIDLCNQPFRLVQECVLSQRAIEGHQEDNAEGVCPQIA